MNNLTPSEARRLIDKLHHNQTKEHGISILEEKYLAALEIALTALEQPEGQFFLVEHHNCYEVETTLFAAMHRRAEFGGRIWALTGSIVKPKTDTYRQIENDGWIEWKGGSVAPVTGLVEVRWSTGSTDIGDAGVWRWEHSKFMVNLVAYRVIENDGREG
ncbi:hypothetical protein [Pantoea sp. WEP]|uniref:hypothetical protein n=1 Tax=Pantoea sp. WEP TaxID=3230025 RepID=UPI0035662AC3